jgi:hypothetical protein
LHARGFCTSSKVLSSFLASNTREILYKLDVVVDDDDDDDDDVVGALDISENSGLDISENSGTVSEDELGWYEIHVMRDVHKYEKDSFLTYLEGLLLRQWFNFTSFLLSLTDIAFHLNLIFPRISNCR